MKTSLRFTKNYSLFDRCLENRPVDLTHRKDLRNSMAVHGWIPAYPMHVVRNKFGRMSIRDGQHRFEISKELGLAVCFVECEDAADISEINNSQRKWFVSDYAGTWAQRGLKDYIELVEFCDKHKMPVSQGAAILSGTVIFNNIKAAYVSGVWKIKDRAFAEQVVALRSETKRINPRVCNNSFLDAISGCCRCAEFDAARFVHNLNKCPEKLVAYGTRDGMLAMIENIYNFGRRDLYPLKIEVEKEMRRRNPAIKKP
jgi:hypothetical protein